MRPQQLCYPAAGTPALYPAQCIYIYIWKRTEDYIKCSCFVIWWWRRKANPAPTIKAFEVVLISIQIKKYYRRIITEKYIRKKRYKECYEILSCSR